MYFCTIFPEICFKNKILKYAQDIASKNNTPPYCC